MLKDADDVVAVLFVVFVSLVTFVIDSNGVLVYHGRIDNSVDPSNVEMNDLANALDDVIAGKTVTKPEAKAFGCSIKRAG